MVLHVGFLVYMCVYFLICTGRVVQWEPSDAAVETPQDIVEETILQTPISPLTALLSVARSIFPDNIALAAVDMNILGVVTFSLFFGMALATLGEAADPFIQGVDVRSVPG